MSLKDTIHSDLKHAMKQRDTLKVSVLRMAISEIKKREIDTRKKLDDEAVQKAVTSLIKQHQDSIEAFKKGGRQDLVDKETQEAELLKTYLPEPLSRQEVEAIVGLVIREVGATSPKDLGKVMRAAIEKTGGRAEGKVVNEIARSLLSSG